jgi:hypothetical protein
MRLSDPRPKGLKLFVMLALFVALLAARTTDAPAQPPAERILEEAGTTRVLADTELIFDTNLGLVERATEEAVFKALDGLRLPPGSEIRLHSLTNHEAAWFVEDFIARFLSERGFKVFLVKPTAAAASGAGAGAAGAPTGGSSLADVSAAQAGTAAADSAAAAAAAATDTTAVEPDEREESDDAPTSITPGPGGPGPRGRIPGAGAGAGAPAAPEVLNPVPEGEGLVLTFRLIEFGVTYHDSWRRGFLGQKVVERLAAVNVYCRLVSGSAENVLWVGGGKSERLDIVPKSKLDLLEGQGSSYPFKRPALPPQPFSRILEPALVAGIIGGLVFLFYSNQN